MFASALRFLLHFRCDTIGPGCHPTTTKSDADGRREDGDEEEHPRYVGSEDLAPLTTRERSTGECRVSRSPSRAGRGESPRCAAPMRCFRRTRLTAGRRRASMSCSPRPPSISRISPTNTQTRRCALYSRRCAKRPASTRSSSHCSIEHTLDRARRRSDEPVRTLQSRTLATASRSSGCRICAIGSSICASSRFAIHRSRGASCARVGALRIAASRRRAASSASRSAESADGLHRAVLDACRATAGMRTCT